MVRRYAAILALVAGLWLSSPALGYLRLHPENRRYFQETTTGKPVLVASVTALVPEQGAWDNTELDYHRLIDDSLTNRLTYSRVWHFGSHNDGIVWPWQFSSTPGAYWGGYKVDMNQWNQTYFDRLTDALSLAGAGGAYAEVMIFDRCGISPASMDRWGSSAWCVDNNINGLETPPGNLDGTPEFYSWQTKPNLKYQQERWIKKLIDSTVTMPNVFYEVENEHWQATSAGWADHYGQYVKDYIAANYPAYPRLVSYSSILSDEDIDQCFNWPCIDVVNYHFGKALDADPSLANAYIEPRWNLNKAINIDEFGNAVWKTDISVLRKECWTILTSGGNFHIEDAPGSWSFAICLNIRSFLALSGWDFVHAAPNKNLITSGGGYCMAQPGVEYLCYFPTGGSKTITLAAGTYRAEWWNNRTGGFYNVTSFSHGGGGKTLSTPDSNDWVLRVTTRPAITATLQSRMTTQTITIDGDSADWNLGDFTTKICGGDTGTGDKAIAGYDTNHVFYCGGHWAGGQWTGDASFDNLSPGDHSARIYSRNGPNYLYFLVRCDDDQLQFSNVTSANWANDSIEFSIDPGHVGGSTPVANSTSKARIVIDAANQENEYGCTEPYKTQVLNGVTSEVRRDSTGWWLEVKIAKSAFNPAIPATGTIGLDFCFHDNDNANDPVRTTVYTWSDPEVSAAFPSLIPNRWGDLQLLAPVPITVPGPVTSFSAIRGNGRNTLVWTNPSDWSFLGTMIRYKTTGYPANASDGTFLCAVPNGQGASDSYVHESLTNGVQYYYAAFAYDGTPSYSAPVNRSATPGYADSLHAKLQRNDLDFTITDGVVTAAWTNDFYVQSLTMPVGLHVLSDGHGLNVGDTIGANGYMKTDLNEERYLLADWVKAHGSGAIEAVRPLALNTRLLGGQSFSYYELLGIGQCGVKAYQGMGAGARPLGDVAGLNNIGLLVRVVGRVVWSDTSCFYLDDGSLCDEFATTSVAESRPPGVRVVLPQGVSAPPTGAKVSATGISSCRKVSGVVYRRLLMRNGADLVVL